LCRVCGLDSEGTSPEGTGAHTPLPATILAHGAPTKGALHSVAAGSGVEGLGSVSDVSSGARTPPQLEVLNRLLEIHLKLESDLQSAPPECSPFEPELPSALPPGLDAPWPVFSQSSPPWIPSAVLPVNVSAFPLPAAATVARKPTARATATMVTTQVPSVGSKGHPHSCAAACKYVKRKGGCRMGAACELCHLCFWQRQSATQDSQAQPQERELDPPANTAESESLTAPEDQNGTPEVGLASLGSRNHPFGCAPACKHIRRKGGCREGAKCPNCHECRWRRAQDGTRCSAGLGPKTVAGYSSEAVDVLEKLIHMQIEKAACKVDIADRTSLADEEEPIKVSLKNNAWLTTEVAHLPGSNATKTEAAAQVKPAGFSQEQLPEDIPSLGSMGHPFTCKLACKYHGKKSGCKDGATCNRCHLCHWSRMAVRTASSPVNILSI